MLTTHIIVAWSLTLCSGLVLPRQHPGASTRVAIVQPAVRRAVVASRLRAVVETILLGKTTETGVIAIMTVATATVVELQRTGSGTVIANATAATVVIAK